MDTLWQDVKYGARMLAKNRGVTLAAVLALALGIGVNSAIFSVVNSVLLRPLPFEDPDRLVMVWGKHKQIGREEASLPDFADWRAQNRSFDRMAGAGYRTFNLTGDGDPERLVGAAVTDGFFELLGLRPVVGRTFLPEEDRPGAARVVILSEALWNRRFGGDQGIIGRALTLNGEPYTVAGVAPKNAVLPMGAELWVPLAMEPAQAGRRNDFLAVGARLKPGITMEQAQADLVTIMARLEQQFPGSNAGWSTEVVPLQEQLTGEIRMPLLVLMGAVGFVLLIACANVANILLARAAAREREIAIRVAMGAGRARLARQLLTESTLLGVLGGGIGLVLAAWGLDVLVRFAGSEIPRLDTVRLDPVVLGFTLALSVATGLLFGFAPAWQAARAPLNESLKEAGRSNMAGRGRHWMRTLLVVSEVALSMVLLVGAGLLIKSLYGLIRQDTGFDRANVLTMRVTVPQSKYPQAAQRADFFNRLLERVRALPGVRAASAVIPLPLSGGANYLSFAIAGRPAPPNEVVQDASSLFISDDYFQTMGIALVRGRSIEPMDVRGGTRAAWINQTLAQRYFRDEDPVGQRLTFGNPANPQTTWMTIAGVVADVKHRAAEREVYPSIYVALPQGTMTLVVRSTSENPLALAPSIRGLVRELDADLPVYSVRTFEQVVESALVQRRFTMGLLSTFAGLALVLAGVGVYGVMSYSVTQRTREIGIRVALGAQRGDIARMVVHEGLLLVMSGLVVGIAAALALARFMTTLVFNVAPTDPMVFALVAFLLAGVALTASYVPARRATRVDPLVALRYE